MNLYDQLELEILCMVALYEVDEPDHQVIPLLKKCAEMARQMERLRDGQEILVPSSTEHAGAMKLMAESYLEVRS